MTFLLLTALALGETPAERFRALEADHQSAIAAYQKALDASSSGGAGGVEARQTLARDHRQRLTALAGQYLALAVASPRAPEAVEALGWVVLNAPWPPAPKADDLRAKALDLLLKDHLASEKLGPLCTRLVRAPDAASETFLRAVFDKSPVEGVQARACMSLALNRKFRAAATERMKADPEEAKAYRAVWGNAAVDALLKRDPELVRDSSRRLLEYAKKVHPGVRHPQHGDLGKLADTVLATLAAPVTVGKPAPPLAGTDLDDKPVSLADYKGRVVLLDFGGLQFPPSRAALAAQQALAKKLAGQPFALLSVTADSDRPTARKAWAEAGATWRAVYDGGAVGGPLATRWDVEAWPTVFLIGADGVVRSASVGWPAEADVREAVEEALKAVKGGK